MGCWPICKWNMSSYEIVVMPKLRILGFWDFCKSYCKLPKVGAPPEKELTQWQSRKQVVKVAETHLVKYGTPSMPWPRTPSDPKGCCEQRQLCVICASMSERLLPVRAKVSVSLLVFVITWKMYWNGSWRQRRKLFLNLVFESSAWSWPTMTNCSKKRKLLIFLVEKSNSNKKCSLNWWDWKKYIVLYINWGPNLFDSSDQ